MVSRRAFIWSGISVAGGLAVGLGWPRARRLAQSYRYAPLLGNDDASPCLIEIRPDNSIVVASSLSELGQGVATLTAQIVGEELDAQWEQIIVRMAPSWRAYSYPIGFYTGGSSSAQRLYKDMRRVAAAARHMLVAAAARRWNIPFDDCHTAEGVVFDAAGERRTTYGELCADAAQQPKPQQPHVKERRHWKLLGTPRNNLYARDIVTATARYGMDVMGRDVSLPNMRIAAIAQSPVEGAKLTGYDRAAILARRGVHDIVDLGDTLAVVADSYWIASQALASAMVQWTATTDNTTALRKDLLDAIATEPHPDTQSNGMPKNWRVVAATYDAPFVGHVQAEPLNAIAHVTATGADLWVPTQIQEAMQAQLAKALGLWTHAVTIHTPFVGGGFGRRLRADYGIAAARIAKAVGYPVKTIWSREHDLLQDRFRPMSAARLSARLDESGTIKQWHAHVAAIGDVQRLYGVDDPPYAVAQKSIAYSGVASRIRTGPWRSVDASQNVFFRESFIDECALACGIDPLAYRKQLLRTNARAQRVLTTLAEVFRWDSAQREHRLVGIAFHDGFGSIAALAVELTPSTDRWRVARLWVVVDCGTALNPNGIRAQLEGGTLFGLSAALFEQATYRKGQLEQRNYDTYRVLRINETPDVHVTILETEDAPIGGMGEVGVPLVAPAVANALASATTKRVRSLPLIESGLLDY